MFGIFLPSSYNRVVSTATLLVGLSNTAHILATVIWIGWSLLLVAVVAPQALVAYAPDTSGWLASTVRRLPPLAYLALAALGVTGMYQLVAHPNYVDLLALANTWSLLIFIKHLAVVGNAGLMAYLAGVLVPEVRFQLWAAARGRGDANRLRILARRFRWLAWLNLALGAVVLLMTGLATAIPSPLR